MNYIILKSSQLNLCCNITVSDMIFYREICNKSFLHTYCNMNFLNELILVFQLPTNTLLELYNPIIINVVNKTETQFPI